MQAIQTRYIGPTNTRGSRIKATASAGSITLPYSHDLSADDNHARAAFALSQKFAWTWGYLCGEHENGERTFVAIPKTLAPHARGVQAAYWSLRDMLSICDSPDGREILRDAMRHLIDANTGLF